MNLRLGDAAWREAQGAEGAAGVRARAYGYILGRRFHNGDRRQYSNEIRDRTSQQARTDRGEAVANFKKSVEGTRRDGGHDSNETRGGWWFALAGHCCSIDADTARVFETADISNETRGGSFVVVVAIAFLEKQWTRVQQRNPRLPSRPLCTPFEAQRERSRLHLPRSLDLPAGLMFSQLPSVQEKK